MTRRLISIAVAAVSLNAVPASAQNAAKQAARADTVVRQVGRPVHTGVASLVQEMSVGIADGDEHYILGNIADIAVAPNGTLYVYDKSIPAIRMYNAAGKYVTTIGGKGRGPGEYAAAAGIDVAKNGNLLMWDPGNGRVNVYSAAGAVLTHWPTLVNGSMTIAGRNLVMVDTAGLTWLNRPQYTRVPGKQPERRQTWVRFRPDGTIQDTLEAPPMSLPTPVVSVTSSGGMAEMSMAVPFSPVAFSAASPLGHFVTGAPNRYAFEIVEAGKPIVSIRKDVTLAGVSRSERDSARSAVTERMRESDPAWTWNGADIPGNKPAYLRAAVALDGRVWIVVHEVPAPISKDPKDRPQPTRIGGGQIGKSGPPPGVGGYSCPAKGPTTYDVFEPTGNWLGQVQVPVRVSLLKMRGDQVWAETCDADDVPSVRRYRISWR